MSVRAGRGSRLGGPIAGSVLLHGAALAALLVTRPPPEAARPPVYKVNIVAAPPGPRQAGVVRPPAAEPEPPRPAQTPPTRAEVNPRQMPAPATRTPPRRQPPAPATPNPRPAERQTPAADAPTAGGGPTGDVGTDVATVRTEGIEFPYQGYLNNIVRQIALRFKPDNPNAALRAEIAFIIRRDGSVTGVRFITQSGRYDFDLEAMGAVEAAVNANAFGPLPEGYQQEVLPVIFSFDPRLIR